MIVYLYVWEFLSLSQHDANADGFKDCGSVEKIFLMFQVVSRDQVSVTLLVRSSHSKPLPYHYPFNFQRP